MKNQYKNRWLLQQGSMNGRPTVTLKAGLSAQICFAKYVAFKRKSFYKGYQRAAPIITQNFVEQTLKYIEQEVKSHLNIGKTVLYSPGICSVPYLVQTADMIYLPSHFLVGVNHIEELVRLLDCSYKKGYRCYAVLGYDPFFKDKLCAWIKFNQPPKEYINIIKYFHINNVIIMSCHDTKGTNHGAQRKARLIVGDHIQEERYQPRPNDIYVIFIKEENKGSSQADVAIFKKLIKDKQQSFWKSTAAKPICNYIHDWQSGIDCIQSIQYKFRYHLQGHNVDYYYVLNSDSWNLYLVAYYLAKQFILHNYNQQKHPIKTKGIVFNQYIMSNPTYELNYGYIPILYWQFYSQNQKRILSTLTEEEKQLGRWFNMHQHTKIDLIQSNSVVIKTNHQGLQLVNWTTKYAPKEYDLKYLTIDQVVDCLKKYKLIYKKQFCLIK